MGSRFFAVYDLNHDGKVTRDEVNKVQGQRFAASSKGGAMSLDQFNAGRLNGYRQYVDRTFHRVDWNNDGRVTLDEYMASERSYFASLDRQGNGAVACGGARSADAGGRPSYRSRSGRGDRGLFCTASDLNKDGQVTRAEFDKAAQQRFASAAKGGGVLNGDQFYQIALARFRDSNARYFQRLDTNHDGRLSLVEYAASSQRMFARADKNNDGVITQNEVGRTDYRRADRPAAQGPRRPG
jgi:Ca2+-binding EF-hand superfamily protein